MRNVCQARRHNDILMHSRSSEDLARLLNRDRRFGMRVFAALTSGAPDLQSGYRANSLADCRDNGLHRTLRHAGVGGFRLLAQMTRVTAATRPPFPR